MTTMEQKLNALTAFVMAEDETSRQTARKALETAMRTKTGPEIKVTSAQEDTVHQFLLEIGADPSLLGYKYIVYGILQIALHPDLIDNITGGFYPKVAMQFDTTASRAERAIRHAIERMWECGDVDTLVKYFGLSVSNEKGKPTNGQFLARSALVIRHRLKQ